MKADGHASLGTAMLPADLLIGSRERNAAGLTRVDERSQPGVALALGGGAARGMAHIGVLKAFEARGRPPRIVAGTSYGAIIAALYGLAGNALELEQIVRAQDVGEMWRQGLDFGFHRGALINGQRLSSWLDRKFFLGATFADLQVPIAIACTDLASGELVVVRSGSLAEAVRASCALPGLFAPVKWEGRSLIDGGFLEPIPFRALGDVGADWQVGIHAGIDVRRSNVVRAIRHFNASRPGRSFLAAAHNIDVNGPFGQMLRGMAISLRSYSLGVHVPASATLLRVDPQVSWWDFHQSPRAIAAGERAALALLDAEDAPGLEEPTSDAMTRGSDASDEERRRGASR